MTSSKKAVLLGTDTEVYIAPKLRNSTTSEAAKIQQPKKDTKGTALSPSGVIDQSNSSQKPQSSAGTNSVGISRSRPVALRNLPTRLIDTSSLPALNTHSYGSSTCAIFVSPTTFSRICSHHSLLSKNDSAFGHASIRVLPAPSTKSIPITGGPTLSTSGNTGQNQSSLAAARQLLLDGSNRDGKLDAKKSEEKEKPERERVLVCSLGGVPEQHLVISGSGQLPRSNAGDWDLIS